MAAHECDREVEVLEAIGRGHWPARCEVSLRAHVAGCPVCRDLVEIAVPLHDDGAALRGQVRVPSAGSVWWRAQVRARAEAEQAAMRPMLIAGACGATVLLACLASVVTLGWPWASHFLSESVAVLVKLQPEVGVQVDVLPHVRGLVERWLLPLVVLLIVAVVAPVAVYLADRSQV